MEVGAVKQAFNNELILLKKKLNQAKIQVIHKLTRKAKNLVDKKAPEPLQEKFKKKAESAVKEVLIIKKIKPRHIGRFIITHTKQLQDHLNKPQVDLDKACARLLLHKALVDKYKSIRDRFSHVSINDLLMSRQERRKLKKEARELQKNKNKAKNDRKKEKSNVEGDWEVEDVIKDDKSGKNFVNFDGDEQSCNREERDSDDDEEEIDDGDDIRDLDNESEDNSDERHGDGNDVDSENNDSDQVSSSIHKPDTKTNKSKLNPKPALKEKTEISDTEIDEECSDEDSNHSISEMVEKTVTNSNKTKPKPTPVTKEKLDLYDPKFAIKEDEFQLKLTKNKIEKKQKDNNKNRNLKDKIQQKKFKKETEESSTTQKKIIDPFFITASGENYMSVVEVRPPDEIKDEHRQGNRQLRRAKQFGHVPKVKPRSNFRQNNNFEPNFDRRNGNRDQRNSDNNYKHNNERNNFKHKDNKRGNFIERDDDRNFKRDDTKGGGLKRPLEDSKPEKLHPSWEAKKKLSGIQPFKGKKIVFD